MVKFLTSAGKTTGRLVILAGLTATLAACGGGSSGDDDTTILAEQDADGDLIPNGEDPDADGDGQTDYGPNGELLDFDIDLDGDGFDDVIGEQDLDGDFIANKNDPDADGDGLDDFKTLPNLEREDPFVDLNQDGFDDTSGLPEQAPFTPIPVSDSEPCGGEPGDDNDSSNASWNDNCWVRVNNGTGQGQFARSLYTVGIQRIVYCAAGSVAVGDNYAAFADGIFGTNTETALKAFQASEPDPQTDDGEVGPRTWAKLQAAVTRLNPGDLQADGTAQDSYGFAEGRCAGTPLFYQTVIVNPDTQIADPAGWRLAKNTPASAETAPFSVDSSINAVK